MLSFQHRILRVSLGTKCRFSYRNHTFFFISTLTKRQTIIQSKSKQKENQKNKTKIKFKIKTLRNIHLREIRLWWNATHRINA